MFLTSRVHLPAQARVQGELRVDPPVVLDEAGEVGAGAVVEEQVLVGLAAADRDREQEVVVVDAPVAVQVELREVLHELDAPVAEDPEVEGPLRARDLGPDPEGVGPPHQGKRVAELEPLLRGGLRHPEAGAVLDARKRELPARSHGHDVVGVVAVAAAEGVDHRGREGAGPGDEAHVVLVGARLTLARGADAPDRGCSPRCRRRSRRRSGSSGCPCRTLPRRRGRWPGGRREAPGRRSAGSSASPRRARRPGPPHPGSGTRSPRTTRPCPGREGRPGSRSTVAGRRTGSGPGCGRRSRAAPASASSRRKKEAEPWRVSEPLFVTTLIAEAAERPWSAEKRLVAIWNSCTASWGRLASGPPTTSSLLSWPSIVMLPPASELARRGDGDAVGLRGIEVGGGGVAGNEEGQLQEVATVQGQVVDRARRHDAPHHRARRFEAATEVLHVDDLRLSGHVEGGVQGHPASHLQPHARGLRGEARGLDLDRVGARAEARKDVVAGGGRRRLSDEARSLPCGLHLGPGDGRARGVGHAADQHGRRRVLGGCVQRPADGEDGYESGEGGASRSDGQWASWIRVK